MSESAGGGISKSVISFCFFFAPSLLLSLLAVSYKQTEALHVVNVPATCPLGMLRLRLGGTVLLLDLVEVGVQGPNV